MIKCHYTTHEHSWYYIGFDVGCEWCEASIPYDEVKSVGSLLDNDSSYCLYMRLEDLARMFVELWEAMQGDEK